MTSERDVPALQTSKRGNMKRRLLAPLFAIAAGVVGAVSHVSAGQEPVPVVGTISLEGTVDKTYAAANTVIVKTTDGIKHLFHFTKQTAVHGAKDAGEGTLSGFREGSRVIVHYTVVGGEETAVEVDRLGEDGLHEMKGVVTRVDPGSKRISVRLADATVETLQLSERTARDAGKEVTRAADEGANVVVYYTNEGGKKVAHYFKKIS
jgi:hypothetical protein